MATVPVYGPPRVRPEPAPRARWRAAPTAESEGAGVGQAIAGFGTEVANLGVQLWQRAQERADEIRYRDVGETLARWEVDRRTNPDTGWLSLRGINALRLPDTIESDFTRVRGEITKDLHPRQRLMVEQMVDARLADARRWGIARTNAEFAAHDQERHDSYVANAIQNGIAYSPHDRDRAAVERDRILAETAEWGRRNGRSPEAIAAEALKATTVLHRGVVLQLAVAGQDVDAQRYYDRVKNEIDGTTRTQLEEQLETASTSGVALRAAEMIWQQRGPRNDADPIQLDLMEEDARVAFHDRPKILKATIDYLRERRAGVDVARKEREDATAGGLWAAVAEGRTLTDIRRMPEFLRAPGRLQVQIIDGVLARAEREANRAAAVERRALDAEQRAFTRETRAYTRQERAEAEKTERGWSQFWELSKPEVLSQLSDHALNAQRGELGDELVNRLFTLKRKVETPEALHAAEIDTNQFNTIADKAGLNPYGAKEEETRRLGRLRDAVERAIDVEQRRRGNKPLTREEKGALMEQVIDDDVLIRWRFGRDPRQVAAMVLESERGYAYVPFAEIPSEAVQDYRTYVRALPGNGRLTDRELDAVYGRRLERAWAERLIGGTRAEIEAILKGQTP